MECGLSVLFGVEPSADLDVDQFREGQLLALILGLPCAVLVHLVLWLAL